MGNVSVPTTTRAAVAAQAPRPLKDTGLVKNAFSKTTIVRGMLNNVAADDTAFATGGGGGGGACVAFSFVKKR
jgi:hypothetical protein